MKKGRFGKTVVTSLDTSPETHATVEEGVDAVRLRPGMYVGGTDVEGLHQLFKEIIDNAVNEVMASHCTEIKVIYGADHSLSVEDNGRGIPVEVDAETGKSIVELVLTNLSLSRRLVARRDDIPRSPWGFPVPCVNALPAWLVCEVKQGGTIYHQRFERGVPDGPLLVVGKCGTEEHGTKITWLADRDIFQQALNEKGLPHYDPGHLRNRLRELAYLNKGITITFYDVLHGHEPEVYCFKHGIADYVAQRTATGNVLHSDVVYFSGEQEGVTVEVALQFSDRPDEAVYCYANNLFLSHAGTPYSGFKKALTRSINQYARKQGYLAGAYARFAEDDSRGGLTALATLAYPNLSRTRRFSNADISEGLSVVISVRLPNPIFQSTGRNRLMNTEVEPLVDRVTGKEITKFLNRNPQAA